MAKDLRSFIAECQRELPGEVIHITKEVNPANYDVTAIIKHLGAQKRFPIIIFDKPLNLNGKVGPIKLTMNCEISQGKTQIALGMGVRFSNFHTTALCSPTRSSLLTGRNATSNGMAT